MYRIPVTCEGKDGKRAHAPFVTAEVELQGHTSPVLAFMIDTGADQTAVSQRALRLPGSVYREGTKETTHGVGGAWPARRFIGEGSIVVPAKDSDGHDALIRLPLPKLSVLAPVADRSDPAKPKEKLRVSPDDRRLDKGDLERATEGHPLLGRDVIFEAEAELHYDPRGDSAIEVPAVASEVEIMEEH